MLDYKSIWNWSVEELKEGGGVCANYTKSTAEWSRWAVPVRKRRRRRRKKRKGWNGWKGKTDAGWPLQGTCTRQRINNCAFMPPATTFHSVRNYTYAHRGQFQGKRERERETSASTVQCIYIQIPNHLDSIQHYIRKSHIRN